MNSDDYEVVMNKSELISIVAKKFDAPRKNIEKAVDLVFDSMVQALMREERIEIRGIGSFVVRHYRSYLGRNPRTGERIEVGTKRLPFFKAGKELKERVDRL